MNDDELAWAVADLLIIALVLLVMIATARWLRR